jgi:hypothetical protein
MTAIYTIFIILFSGIILHESYRYYKKFQKRKSQRLLNSNKIEHITKKIYQLITDRISEEYHTDLKTNIDNTISNIYKINNNNKILIDIDSIYCNLKKDLRILDEYNEFNDKFSYRKRKYRMVFNKSMGIIGLLENKYDKDIVQKYLVSFDTDFSNTKINEVNELNKLNRNCKALYKRYSIYELTKLFNEIKRIDCNIITKLNEPSRLRDKFILSEDNIDQLENELTNTKGSLYYKVFNMIKVNKVSKEDTNEWNIIKRNINNFKRNKLLKIDVIESSNKLNSIINSLTDLNNTISINTKSKEGQKSNIINL